MSSFLTPSSMRNIPFRQILAAHVGVYGRAISVELNKPNPHLEHVENLCTDYHARVRLLHYIINFEDKLKEEILDDVD